MNKKINPEIIDEMVEYFETHTANETEREFNVSEGLPQYYHIKKHGHRKPPIVKKLTSEQSKEVADFAHYNTIGSTTMKFGIQKKSVIHHYGKHYGKNHPCIEREMLEDEIGNENRSLGELKRVHQLSKGEWFKHCGQSYRVAAKNEIFYTCSRYDYAQKRFNGKLELGIKNQMKVQTLVLQEPDELIIKSRQNRGDIQKQK